MIRLISVAAIVLAVGSSFGLYQLKYQTAIAEREAGKLKAQVAKEEEMVHVLRAEWNYLNRPENLQAMVEKHLPEMREVKPAQLVDMSEIPYRPLSMEDLIGEIEGQTREDESFGPTGPESSLTRGGKVNG